MLQRNEQSHEVRRRSPEPLPEDEIPEDSSESTDYEDSSLIESFHAQLAFQDDDKKAISQTVLNREQENTAWTPMKESRNNLQN
jgi:hypothetical protein